MVVSRWVWCMLVRAVVVLPPPVTVTPTTHQPSARADDGVDEVVEGGRKVWTDNSEKQ